MHTCRHTCKHAYTHTSMDAQAPPATPSHLSTQPAIQRDMHSWIKECTYIHTQNSYIHTYVHTCMQRYTDTCFLPSIFLSFLPTCIHDCIHNYIHSYTFTHIHTYIHSQVHIRHTAHYNYSSVHISLIRDHANAVTWSLRENASASESGEATIP